MDTHTLERLIPLDTTVYCPVVVAVSGGDKTCKHDFPPEKTRDEDDWAEWTCSKCGMRVRYEVWC